MVYSPTFAALKEECTTPRNKRVREVDPNDSDDDATPRAKVPQLGSHGMRKKLEEDLG